ncbi:hypothetical protein INR49_018445, partial [Caranx melampygus]
MLVGLLVQLYVSHFVSAFTATPSPPSALGRDRWSRELLSGGPREVRPAGGCEEVDCPRSRYSASPSSRRRRCLLVEGACCSSSPDFGAVGRLFWTVPVIAPPPTIPITQHPSLWI